MIPSISHSIQGSFFFLQPSSICTIIATHRIYLVILFDIKESIHTLPEEGSTTLTHGHCYILDPDIDSSLYTPLKQVQLMHSAIMLTSTGSLLLLKAKLISADANQLISAPVIDNLPTLLQPD